MLEESRKFSLEEVLWEEAALSNCILEALVARLSGEERTNVSERQRLPELG